MQTITLMRLNVEVLLLEKTTQTTTQIMPQYNTSNHLDWIISSVILTEILSKKCKLQSDSAVDRMNCDFIQLLAIY